MQDIPFNVPNSGCANADIINAGIILCKTGIEFFNLPSSWLEWFISLGPLRQKKLEDFFSILMSKMSYLEIKSTESLERTKQDHLARLIEEAVLSVSESSVSESRIQKIASAIAFGLSQNDIDIDEECKIVKLLSLVTDKDILILKAFSDSITNNAEYKRRHPQIFPSRKNGKSEPENLNRCEELNSRKDYLAGQGLLKKYPAWSVIIDDNHDEFYENTGTGYAISYLGNKLLQRIEQN